MRFKTILTVIVVIMLIAVVAVAVILKSMDFNEYRGIISQEVHKATGRVLKINGKLDLKLSFSPAIAVNDVSFANASWGTQPEMVKIKRLEIVVNLFPLIFGDIRIKRFVLIEPDILLETDAEGRGNWVLGKTEKPPAKLDSPDQTDDQDAIIPLVNELRIKNATLTYRDGRTQKTINFSLNSFKARSADLQSPFYLDTDGAYGKHRFEVTAELGPLEQLINPTVPYPVHLKGQSFGTTIRLDGTVKIPLQGKGLNLKLSIKGNDLTKVTELAEVQLPLDGPFQIAAHLTDPKGTYSLKDINVKLGRSSLAGTAAIKISGKRPSINASFNPLYFDLSQLGPAKEKEKAKTGKSGKKSDRVFSSDPFPLEGLQAADAIIKITNGTILSDGMEIKNLELNIILKNGNLSIKPVKASILDGSVIANLSLKTRGEETVDIKTDITVKKINIAKFLKDKKITDLVSKGNLDVKADIEGSGKSLRTLMAGLDGNVSIIMDKGRIENKYIDFLASDLMKLLMPGGANKEFTVVNCYVARFDIKNGMAESRGILLDTDNITVAGDGNINLADEKLNLTFNPKPKKASLISLAVPLNVRGTFLNPSFAPDTAAVAKKVVGGILGNVILPGAGLLVPLVSKGSDDKNPCIAALSQSKRPTSTTKPASQSKQEDKKPADEVKGVLESLGKGLGGLFK